MKQGTMLMTLCCLVGGCANPAPRARTFVMSGQAPMTALPEAAEFPELKRAIDRVGPNLARALGYKGYVVGAVLPQESQWSYVRDPRLQVVVRRQALLGVALRRDAAADRCLYLEPIMVQDRLGARDWGPLRLGTDRYRARRMDCGLIAPSLASR